MILVTGGTGLLGAQLLYDLTKAGHKVRALKRSTSVDSHIRTSAHPQIHTSIDWVEGDVLDVYSLAEAMRGVEQVYHCAGVVSYNPALNQTMLKVNAEGTANVVNMALEAG